MKKANFTNSCWKQNLSNWVKLSFIPILLVCMGNFTTLQAQTCSLACKTGVQISVDQNCEATLTQDMFVNGQATSCPNIVTSGTITLKDAHGKVINDAGGTPILNMPIPLAGSYLWDSASEHIGTTVEFTIRDGSTGNSCWGYAKVEDKIGPIIECPTDPIEVYCCETLGFDDVTITDNCNTVIERIYTDISTTKNDCSGDFLGLGDEGNLIIKRVQKVVTAKDEYGNMSTSPQCTLSVDVLRLNVNTNLDLGVLEFGNRNRALVCPPNYTVAPNIPQDNPIPADLDPFKCDKVTPAMDLDKDGIPDPTLAGAGVPFIDKTLRPYRVAPGAPNDTVYIYPLNFNGGTINTELLEQCGIGATYEDTRFPTIKCTTKVMRIWTIYEWFCGREFITRCTQIIEVVDDEGPTFETPLHDFVASTNGYTCEGQVWLNKLDLKDNCGDIGHVDVRITPEDPEAPAIFKQNFAWATGGYVLLPTGVNKVVFSAYDACHNVSKDSLYITVEDHTPPVTICDQHTVVSLTYDGEAEVKASVFDDGSYDDCGLKTMLVRRMNQTCNCEDHYPKFDNMYFLGKYEGHYYYLSKDELPGHKALKVAKAMGGYAAVIEDKEEDAWIFGSVEGLLDQLEDTNPEMRYWIGLTDRNHEGVFEWEDGSVFDYSNWDTNMPSTGPAGDRQDYVTVKNNGRWADVNVLNPNRIHRYVLEVEDPCGWTGYTTFCCSDLGTDQMVAFRAVDYWGNFNDCMVSVEVQDKYPPVITCPPNLTLSCQFAWSDISVFGDVVDGAENREAIIIPDGYLINASGGLWDGYAHDNCSVSIMENTPVTEMDACGQGQIIRSWKAWTPGATDTARCWQYIDFLREGPEDVTIDWPSDEDLDGCMSLDADTRTLLNPDTYGRPEFLGEGVCDLVGTTYEDEVYYFNNTAGNACFKVIRTWRVINWCDLELTYTGKDEDGDDRQQIFKINNGVAPVITQPAPVDVCTYDATCQAGPVVLSASATDDCTLAANLRWEYKVDLYNDGSFDAGYSEVGHGGTADASGDYPVGNHTVKYTFEDLCGNKTTTNQAFTVKNCKTPTPYCIDGLAIDLNEMDLTGDGVADTVMAVIWASDFLPQQPTHPCGYEVLVSFDTKLQELSRNFTCADRGTRSINVYFSTIVKGVNRIDTLQSWCITTISVQDNKGVCAAVREASVSGIISTENNAMVSDVQVDLVGSEFPSVMTNGTGGYAFPLMSTGGNYVVDPAKNTDPVNGVSTLDLVLIQKHVLGLNLLDSPYKIIAADINKDQTVSASDLVELRKMILGVQDEFQHNESWRFIDDSYAFSNPAKPLAELFSEAYNINNLENNMIVDFTAVKVGDVNNSVTLANYTGTEVRSNQSLKLALANQNVVAGQRISMPFMAAQDQQITGYQFTFQYDAANLNFAGIDGGSLDLTDANIGTNRLANGIITVSWNSAEAVSLTEGEQLFALNFDAKGATEIANNVSINSRVTTAEAYNANNEVMNVELEFRNGETKVENAGFALYQNTPNPFSSTTEISFVLPETMEAELTVYDVTGRTVRNITNTFNKGVNTVSLKASDLGTSGVLYYTLTANNFSATKRMVVLK